MNFYTTNVKIYDKFNKYSVYLITVKLFKNDVKQRIVSRKLISDPIHTHFTPLSATPYILLLCEYPRTVLNNILAHRLVAARSVSRKINPITCCMYAMGALNNFPTTTGLRFSLNLLCIRTALYIHLYISLRARVRFTSRTPCCTP